MTSKKDWKILKTLLNYDKIRDYKADKIPERLVGGFVPVYHAMRDINTKKVIDSHSDTYLDKRLCQEFNFCEKEKLRIFIKEETIDKNTFLKLNNLSKENFDKLNDLTSRERGENNKILGYAILTKKGKEMNFYRVKRDMETICKLLKEIISNNNSIITLEEFERSSYYKDLILKPILEAIFDINRGLKWINDNISNKQLEKYDELKQCFILSIPDYFIIPPYLILAFFESGLYKNSNNKIYVHDNFLKNLKIGTIIHSYYICAYINEKSRKRKEKYEKSYKEIKELIK